MKLRFDLIQAASNYLYANHVVTECFWAHYGHYARLRFDTKTQLGRFVQTVMTDSSISSLRR